jgi:AraC-like DNA-binding protein
MHNLLPPPAIREPTDYFKGRGGVTALPTPTDVLLFVRRERKQLQQKALQNRSHHRWVLMFNLQTGGQVHVNHRSHLLQPGDALLIMPYQFHHFTHLETSRLLWLFCTFELASTPLLDALRHRVLTVEGPAAEARNRLVALWEEAERATQPDPVHGPLLQSSVLQVLLELRQQAGSGAPALPVPPGNRLLETINRLLDAREPRPATIADLARHLDISESNLRARFRETAGVPLGQYLRNYRINRAMALLRTSDLPVSEVADESGFASPQAFSRAFREATGQSPRAYRSSFPV